MDNQNSIKSYYYQLIDIFNEDKIGRLIVPDYQRGFDWSQSHVDDLWEDLKYYLAKECYEKIFAIGENVNFPKITDQVIEKF